MIFRVRFTPEADADLERLFDVVLERELARDGGELSQAAWAVEAILAGVHTLRHSPFTCRKAGGDAFLRELVIPFGSAGCVALFEVESATEVVVVAVRHQREDDYH